MQVSEVMHKGVSTVQINDSLKKVANIMKNSDIGSLPVYKNERPVGFVTDRDIVITCVAAGHSVDDPISHAMSKEIFCVHGKDDISIASNMMKNKQVSRLLVIDDGDKPIGMLTLKDLTQNKNSDDIHSDVLCDIKR